MNRKRCRAAAYLLSAGLLLSPLFGTARAEGLYKNLQVLPKTIEKPELKKIMKAQAKALGVECDYCHTQPNMDAETDHKKLSRDMMRLVDDINKGALRPFGGKAIKKAQDYYKKHFDGKKDVTCNTCHQGKEEPAKEPPKDAK